MPTNSESSSSLERQVERALELFGRNGKGAARKFRLERDLVVVWSLYRHWTVDATARVLGVHPSTARRYQRAIWSFPPRLCFLPLLRQSVKADKTLWTCEICGAEMRCRERAARKHVALHVIPPWIITTFGLLPKDVYPDDDW